MKPTNRFLAVALMTGIAFPAAALPFQNVDDETRHRLTEYALSHAYTESEAQSLLEALDQVPSRTTPQPPSLPEYVLAATPPDSQSFTAVVNPVCSECGRVLDLLLQAHIMLLPIDTEGSRTAAALLDWMRENASDAFLPTLLDLTSHEPHTAKEVLAIARNYVPISKQVSTVITKKARQPLPRVAVDGPTFFYRGRVLSPLRLDGVVYDPLKNATLLAEALTTIDRYFAKH
jgi:hypothetical protein